MVTYRDQLMSTPSRLPFIAEASWRRYLTKRVVSALLTPSDTRKGRQANRNLMAAAEYLPIAVIEQYVFSGLPR